MVADQKRRNFLRVAAASGALALAGCLGGDGESNGDGDSAGTTTTTTTANGGSGTTTANGGSGTTTVADLPEGSCDSLTALGYGRFDPSDKPVFFDFEHPNGWKFSDVDLDTVYGANYLTEVDIDEESRSFLVSYVLSKEPANMDLYDEDPPEGWTAYKHDFGGRTVSFDISPKGSFRSMASQAGGFMPFESGGEVTFHSFHITISSVSGQFTECEDTLIAMRDRIVRSIRPNPNNDFTPYYEEE